MPSLLAIQPDRPQADALREALALSAARKVLVADSIDDALASIDHGIPDVILLPHLMPAAVEEYLVAYLRAIPGTSHVQIMGLPRLERAAPAIPSPVRPRYSWQSLLRWPWRQKPRGFVHRGYDPELFSQDVNAYFAGATALKKEIEIYDSHGRWRDSADRRREPRFENHEVPWISLLRFGNTHAALINVSSRGALLLTSARPEPHLLKRSGPNAREPHLTLGLHSESEIVHAAREAEVVVDLIGGTWRESDDFQIGLCRNG